jgi:hypothetical protein
MKNIARKDPRLTDQEVIECLEEEKQIPVTKSKQLYDIITNDNSLSE